MLGRIASRDADGCGRLAAPDLEYQRAMAKALGLWPLISL